MSCCQSRLLRAKRETSRAATAPTLPRQTSATIRSKPARATPPAAERPRSSSTVSMRDQPSAVRRSRIAYCKALLSRLWRTCWAEDCRTYRIALRSRWCGLIFSDIMTHLLPLPSEVAVGLTEDQADHQLRQRMARLGGQRLPLRRLRRGVGRRVAEQIELTCIAVRMAVSGRRARHGHLPDSRRESPMLRLNPAIAMVRSKRTSHPAAALPRR